MTDQPVERVVSLAHDAGIESRRRCAPEELGVADRPVTAVDQVGGVEQFAGRAQPRAWMDAGWKVEAVDLTAQAVTFVRVGF